MKPYILCQFQYKQYNEIWSQEFHCSRKYKTLCIYRVFQDSCPKTKFRFLILWRSKQAAIALLMRMRSYNLVCNVNFSEKSIFRTFASFRTWRTKMAISNEMRVDMVKLFYANGSSWTNARRALQHKYGDKARKIHLKTINTHTMPYLVRYAALCDSRGS